MQVLVKAGAGPAEPEPAIHAVRAVDQRNTPARHNLEVLLRATGRLRSVDGVRDTRRVVVSRPRS